MKMSILIMAMLYLISPIHGNDYSEYFHGDGTAYTLGETSSGNCNMMHTLANANQNYAALNDKQWDNLHHCGRCAEVSCDDDKCPDTSITQVVQILDRCPECKFGDLDLSPTVFTKITGHGPSRLKVKWKFVDCPVKGNIKYCLKNGSNKFWTAIQPTNVISGVKSMQINGQETKMVDSAYYYLLDGESTTQCDLSNLKVTLTSINGETIEDQISLNKFGCVDGAYQFESGEQSQEPLTTTKVPIVIPVQPIPTNPPHTPPVAQETTISTTIAPTAIPPTTKSPIEEYIQENTYEPAQIPSQEPTHESVQITTQVPVTSPSQVYPQESEQSTTQLLTDEPTQQHIEEPQQSTSQLPSQAPLHLDCVA